MGPPRLRLSTHDVPPDMHAIQGTKDTLWSLDLGELPVPALKGDSRPRPTGGLKLSRLATPYGGGVRVRVSDSDCQRVMLRGPGLLVSLTSHRHSHPGLNLSRSLKAPRDPSASASASASPSGCMLHAAASARKYPGIMLLQDPWRLIRMITPYFWPLDDRFSHAHGGSPPKTSFSSPPNPLSRLSSLIRILRNHPSPSNAP